MEALMEAFMESRASTKAPSIRVEDVSSDQRRVASMVVHAMVDALRRGDEAKAVGLIDMVTGAAQLGFCLLRACETGHPKCTKLLLAAHAAVDHADSDGATPLFAACLKGDCDCVQLLLAAHAAVNQEARNGVTPLYAACIKGNGGCVQLLLAAHAAVNKAASNGTTPLITACVEGNGDCARLLLAAHAVVDQADSNGKTPLIAACLKGDGDCVQLLLAAHAVIDQADRDGRTPLHHACNKGHGDIVKLLVHAGARTDLRSASRAAGTALDVAEAQGHTVIARFLRSRGRASATIVAVDPVSSAERAAAERAAELAAAALLAEEEAEGAHKQQAHTKKASKKAKAKQAGASEARAPAASASAAASGSAEADNEVSAAAGDDEDVVCPAPSAAADEALRVAMAAAQYEVLVGAIEEHHALASEGVLAEARAMRERLHKKRKQESQTLRRKHATEMEMQANLSKLSLHEVTQSPPAAGSAAAEAARALEAPEAPSAPPAAVALTLAELAAATDGFGEQRLIGSGGYG
eukprot:jgi/Chrpa1/13039/Chrysochromulina_OHIO_Genome00018498-RA